MGSNVRRVVGVYRNGRVEIEGPLDWPDGSVVVVTIDPHATKWNSDDRPRTPGEIEEWVRSQEATPAATEEQARDLERALADVQEFFRVCDADCPRRKYPIRPIPDN